MKSGVSKGFWHPNLCCGSSCSGSSSTAACPLSYLQQLKTDPPFITSHTNHRRRSAHKSATFLIHFFLFFLEQSVNCRHGLDEDETLGALGGERVSFKNTWGPHRQVSISVALRAQTSCGSDSFPGFCSQPRCKVWIFLKIQLQNLPFFTF